MASYASPIRTIRPARSVSLPLESNPIISRISDEIKKLKSWEESSSSAAESISIGLSGIAELYGCVGEFLSLPLTQQSLSLHQNDAFLTHLVDGSSRLLEICSGARVMALQLQEEASGNRPETSDYFRTRRRVAKTAKQVLASLKSVERDAVGSWDEFEGAREIDGGRWRVCAVIGVLRCVSIITVSVLEALVSFQGMRPAVKVPLISRLMRGGEKKRGRNELVNADVAARASSSGDVEGAMEALQGGLGGILNGLEGLFSQLTRTRASMLQIFSF